MNVLPWDVDWREAFNDMAWTEHELRMLRSIIDEKLLQIKQVEGGSR